MALHHVTVIFDLALESGSRGDSPLCATNTACATARGQQQGRPPGVTVLLWGARGGPDPPCVEPLPYKRAGVGARGTQNS